MPSTQKRSQMVVTQDPVEGNMILKLATSGEVAMASIAASR